MTSNKKPNLICELFPITKIRIIHIFIFLKLSTLFHAHKQLVQGLAYKNYSVKLSCVVTKRSDEAWVGDPERPQLAGLTAVICFIDYDR